MVTNDFMDESGFPRPAILIERGREGEVKGGIRNFLGTGSQYVLEIATGSEIHGSF